MSIIQVRESGNYKPNDGAGFLKSIKKGKGGKSDIVIDSILSRSGQKINKSDALNLLLAFYERSFRIYGDEGGWEKEAEQLKIDIETIKRFDRNILEYAISEEWGLDMPSVIEFVDEVYDAHAEPILSALDIYVALRNIEVVCINAVQDHRKSIIVFEQEEPSSILTRYNSWYSLRQNFPSKKVRPTGHKNKELSPYLQSHTPIKKRLKSYKMTPSDVALVLKYPELPAIAVELYAGLEEAQQFCKAVAEIYQKPVRHSEILEALEQVGWLENADFFKDGGDELPLLEKITWILSNPTRFC